MYKNFKMILTATLSALLVLALGTGIFDAAAAPANPVRDTAVSPNGFRGGGGRGSAGRTGVQIGSIPTSELGTEEAAGLLFMREEEKLARDVYNQLYSMWGQAIFQNIAQSEQTHMDQVKLLLDRYALTDPALTAGQFSNPSLQALYDQLIAQGSVSLEEALNVGTLIEQTDIADLQTRIAQTDNSDIQLVYNNLMNASYNHLRAFTGGQTGSGQGSGAGSNGKGNGRP